jgi:hypothetical protein
MIKKFVRVINVVLILLWCLAACCLVAERLAGW